MAVNQELKSIIKTIKFKEGITQDVIAANLGVKPTYLSDAINGRVAFSDALRERIYEQYSYIKSEGEMLITDTAPRIEDVSIVRADEEVEIDIIGIARSQNITLHDIATIIGESVIYIENCKGKLFPRHIMRLQERFGESVVDRYVKYSNVVEAEIIEEFPIISEAATTDPNTNIVKYVEENGAELETINPNMLLTNAKVDVAERIKRTSMLPTFQPDDTVFIRFLKDKMKIVDGETYYLDCKNRPTMIRLVKFEGCDKLRLIAKNPQYGDIIIDRSDIINIGVVVALFRMSFGDQYSEIEAIRREKDAERAKKDSQIDNFIDMQREMIAEIRESGKRNDRLIEKIINQ